MLWQFPIRLFEGFFGPHLDFISYITPLPHVYILTLALASLAASASAAITLCNCTGNLTSLLKLEVISI